MRRRALSLFLPRALGFLLGPLAAEAQPSPPVPRRGGLSWHTVTTGARHRDACLQGRHALGYGAGRPIVLAERWGAGPLARLPARAAELVQLPVQGIVAGNATVARATSQAPGHRPLVLAGGEAVGARRSTNIARPAGNLPGLATNAAERRGTWRALRKEAGPAVARGAVLAEPDSTFAGRALRARQGAALALGGQRPSLRGRDPRDRAGACAALSTEPADALVVLPGAVSNLSLHRARTNELAARSRLPTSWESRAAVADGGLRAYGPDIPSWWRRAATDGDKILQGAQPADLPVERPRTFARVINRKTAKALGLTMPPTLLFQAEEGMRCAGEPGGLTPALRRCNGPLYSPFWRDLLPCYPCDRLLWNYQY
jgi:putative ABC transport system substrate-binding protein